MFRRNFEITLSWRSTQIDFFTPFKFLFFCKSEFSICTSTHQSAEVVHTAIQIYLHITRGMSKNLQNCLLWSYLSCTRYHLRTRDMSNGITLWFLTETLLYQSSTTREGSQNEATILFFSIWFSSKYTLGQLTDCKGLLSQERSLLTFHIKLLGYSPSPK